MLGIGMQEMMIIGLAALLIFGPGKMPEVMGQAGKLYKQFREMTGDLTGEFEKTMAEARDLGNQFTKELDPLKNELNAVGGGAKKTTRSTSSSSTSSKSSTPSTNKAKSTTTSSRTSSTKSTSSKTATTSRTSTSSTSSTASKKPATPPVATKDDPDSDFSMFTQDAPERTRRRRRATPAVISDPTPRMLNDTPDAEPVSASSPAVAPVDSALARARQRRQHAGYAQRSA